MLKKYLLPALGGALVLGLVLTLVATSLPALTGAGSTAAHALDGEEGVAAETSLAPAAEEVVVVAEGRVLPVQRATLSMAASGIVEEILVEEGADVQAGEVILRLRDAHQRAAVAEAEAALASAQAQFDALTAGPRPQEVNAAEASLDAAQARLGRLEDGARPEEIAAAQAALAAAQASLQQLYAGPSEAARIAAGAELANAEAALRQAQAAYDQVAGRSDVAMLPQSLQLEQATNAQQAAQARYEALFAEPDADRVAGVQAQVKEALANLERLREPATDHEVAEAEAMVRQAQAQLGLLLAGARAEERAAASAAVDQAQAGLERARASLADTELRAPFGGTVAVLAVRLGEQVVAGTPLAQLAALGAWQVETEDLTELDVVGILPGDRATVTFDAIPGLSLPGTVVRIEPLGQEKLGDITYTVLVQLDEQDARLLWNMTTLVSIP
jgi:HlyD family secretion protein